VFGLSQNLKQFGSVKTGAIMSKFTTLHIGGQVDFLVEVSSSEMLAKLLSFVVGEGIPYYLLGGGSNLLWQDEPFHGVVIKLSAEQPVIKDGLLVAGAGCSLATVVNVAVKNGLGGLEWAAGVPGTVGGAVRGNAGAMDSDTGKSLRQVDVWRDGEVLTLQSEACGFSYRDSMFKRNSDVILMAYYQTIPGDKVALMQKIMGYIKQRNGKYPALPSAGSFFKNVDFKNWKGEFSKLPEQFAKAGKVPAGWVNEQNALKGYRIGGAMVSKEHGNFIVNVDNASQADVRALVEEINRRAYTNFGIELEPEVILVRL
jgi:UDP-N-acetylmuramate dehydrogenase